MDVISNLEDGRLLVDYTKFHDVTPDGSAGSGEPAGSGEQP